MRQRRIWAQRMFNVFLPIQLNFSRNRLHIARIENVPIKLTENPTKLKPKDAEPISIPGTNTATISHNKAASIHKNFGIEKTSFRMRLFAI